MHDDLPKPSAALVRADISAFDKESALVESALTYLFRLLPADNCPEHVLLKVAALNSLYATNIYAIHALTRLIQEADLDTHLAARSPKAVTVITTLTAGGKVRRNYSFATKYCSWHDADHYPIFDSAVECALFRYKKRDKFDSFTYDELRDYTRFIQVLDRFRTRYELQNFSFKEFDKFLWSRGSD